MTATWQQIAAAKRAAEDRLIARFRSDLFRGEAAAEGRGYPTLETPWGLGRQFFSGLYAISVARRSAWPETQAVFDVYSEAYPARRLVVGQMLWGPGRWYDEEPQYDGFFDVHIAERIHKRGPRHLKEQPGVVVYLISKGGADLANPPAPGEPPPELLEARVELERLERGSGNATS